MSKALSEPSTQFPSFSPFMADDDLDDTYDRSVVIDDSYDDQTEILTVISQRIFRHGSI